jgi:hypothetical protein
VVPKFVSLADPASRRTGANGGLAFFAYCTYYVIDLKARCHRRCGGDHHLPDRPRWRPRSVSEK